MKLPPLTLPEIVHELCDQGQLLVRGGEDGVLAKVDFVFIDFKALVGVENGEAFGLCSLFPALVTHDIIFNLVQSFGFKPLYSISLTK